MSEPIPFLTRDERHLLDSLKRYGRMAAVRHYEAAINLVERGLAEDTTPEASMMLLVLTEAGAREAGRDVQASGSSSPAGDS